MAFDCSSHFVQNVFGFARAIVLLLLPCEIGTVTYQYVHSSTYLEPISSIYGVYIDRLSKLMVVFMQGMRREVRAIRESENT